MRLFSILVLRDLPDLSCSRLSVSDGPSIEISSESRPSPRGSGRVDVVSLMFLCDERSFGLALNQYPSVCQLLFLPVQVLYVIDVFLHDLRYRAGPRLGGSDGVHPL